MPIIYRFGPRIVLRLEWRLIVDLSSRAYRERGRVWLWLTISRFELFYILGGLLASRYICSKLLCDAPRSYELSYRAVARDVLAVLTFKATLDPPIPLLLYLLSSLYNVPSSLPIYFTWSSTNIYSTTLGIVSKFSLLP